MQLTVHTNTFIILIVAFALGCLIGYERQHRQRTAGLRTNTLVALGAAIFVHLALSIAGAEGASRVISYVVSGVGFLGAGTIMKEGVNIRGLNTAATLWGAAAVGACVGAQMIGDAVMASFFVLAVNTLLRPFVARINRQPLPDEACEGTYQICVITSEFEQREALMDVKRLLKEQHCLIGSLEIEPFGDDDVEIVAGMLPSSISTRTLETVTNMLLANRMIKQAYYSRINGHT